MDKLYPHIYTSPLLHMVANLATWLAITESCTQALLMFPTIPNNHAYIHACIYTLLQRHAP